MSLKNLNLGLAIKSAVAAIIGASTFTIAVQASPFALRNTHEADFFVSEVASNKTSANDFKIRTASATMRQAVDRLQDTDEFKQAVEKKDSRALSRMIQKEAGVEFPIKVIVSGEDTARKWHISIEADCCPLHGTVTITF
jgi:hypothetical protein